jgi:purine-binding chemotaxis protein CheW
MSSADAKLKSRLAEMRQRFDNAFAQPVPERAAGQYPMLAIVVGAERMAIRLTDTAALVTVQGRVAPVPSSVPELIGVTGIRGILVPVFSLAALLGLESQAGETRWLVLCGPRQAPLALAFEEFESHIQVDASDRLAAVGDGSTRRYRGETVRHGGRLRTLINVPAIVEHITGRSAAATAATKT